MNVIDEVLSKKMPIGILGDGLSGAGVSALLDGVGHRNYEFFAEGKNCLGDDIIDKFGLFVISPGFRPYHKWMKMIYLSKKPWFNELDFASNFFNGKIIAVTGTNGKTSTTEWLAMLFQMSGLCAFSAGNNEKSFSGVLANGVENSSICVCEVSSYQAATMRLLRPDAVIWTNFDEDHINYHRSMHAYFRAKYRLVKLCNNNKRCWAGEWLLDWLEKFRISAENFVFAKKLDCCELFSSGQRDNFSIISKYWLDNGFSESVLKRSLIEFKPPDHRLKMVAEINNMRFWNDSKATNLNAVVAALDSFKHSEFVVLILGGQSKGENIFEFYKKILDYENVKEVLLIGATGVVLKSMFENDCSGRIFRYFSNLELAINHCSAYSTINCDIVLSPGFASFDQFKNYADRGIIFENSVFRLKRELNVLNV